MQEYISTAQPVGSTHVSDAPGVRVSSATVRNDMAYLEQEGFLAQPHTSAGRVPTDKGYRFFVDHLTPAGHFDDVARDQVGDFFNRAHGRLEELLSRTTDLLAHVTQYAAVVVGPSAQAAVVRSVQVVGLSPRMAMVVAVLSNGHVENETIEFENEISDNRLAAATAQLQRVMIGRTLGSVTKPPTSGDEDTDRVTAEALVALQRGSDDSPVFVGGTASVANARFTVHVHVMDSSGTVRPPSAPSPRCGSWA